VKSVPFGPIDAGTYREIVRRALAEDLGGGDITTQATVDTDLRGRDVSAAGSISGLHRPQERWFTVLSR
jgi:nicotinate-nucleotide pyrophosphorylase